MEQLVFNRQSRRAEKGELGQNFFSCRFWMPDWIIITSPLQSNHPPVQFIASHLFPAHLGGTGTTIQSVFLAEGEQCRSLPMGGGGVSGGGIIG